MDCGQDEEVPMGQVRAVVYRRVSTEEQVEGSSLVAQLERCLSYVSAQGWDVGRLR